MSVPADPFNDSIVATLHVGRFVYELCDDFAVWNLGSSTHFLCRFIQSPLLVVTNSDGSSAHCVVENKEEVSVRSLLQ